RCRTRCGSDTAVTITMNDKEQTRIRHGFVGVEIGTCWEKEGDGQDEGMREKMKRRLQNCSVWKNEELDKESEI
ncbi:hypothetical protein A2U01_0008324, partial [Trifolium medium]|nr:hypothetical protein [Trifolium medium]